MNIICSKFDNSVKKAKQLEKEDCGKIMFVEDFENIEQSTKCGDVFYVLCQTDKKQELMISLDQKGAKILNKKALVSNLNKFEIQSILLKNQINVPKILNGDFEKSDFPMFCKSKVHADFNAKFYNKSTFEKFFSKFDKNDFYFEADANPDNTPIIKAYFVCGRIFVNENTKNNKTINKIENICEKVSKIFDFDIFSAEFFDNNNTPCLFDLNFQTGLFTSQEARIYFKNYFSR